MNAAASDAPGGDRTAMPEYRCPRCAGPVSRVQRQSLDRFINQFSPVHRFRCQWQSCGWEGRLRVKDA